MNTIIPFGKYKGRAIEDIITFDRGYVRWMAENMKGEFADVAVKLLKPTLPSSILTPKKPASHKITVSLFKKDTVAVSFPFNQLIINKLKSGVDGAKWNATNSHWQIPTAKLPELIKEFGFENITGDEASFKEYQAELTRRKDLETIRAKTDTVIDIKGLKITLRDYQRVAVEYALRSDGRFLLADEPGVGKTFSAIAFALATNSKTLIVCPKSVKENWRRQIRRATGKEATVWSSEGKEGRIDATYHIINYDIVETHFKQLKDAGFDLLVADEATHLKNRKTKRAMALLGDWKQRKKYPGIKTKYVIFLTGTPILNRPIEAFSLLNFIDNSRFSNFYHFVERYGGWMGQESRNLDELRDRTKDLILRRKLKDVVKELPDKQRTDVFVTLDTKEKKEYNKLLDELFAKWGASQKPGLTQMQKLESFLISKKLPRVKELIDSYLDNDNPILIFSTRIDPLKELKEHYGDKAVMLDGSITNEKKRQQVIDKLIAGEAKVGLFSLTAGSMGIDGLQEQISNVVFLNMWWTPAVHEQAEGRAYRQGQKMPVNVYYMVCTDTVDEYMREILQEKQDIIDTVMDGELLNNVRGKSFFKQFINLIRRSVLSGNIKDIGDVEEPNLDTFN